MAPEPEKTETVDAAAEPGGPDVRADGDQPYADAHRRPGDLPASHGRWTGVRARHPCRVLRAGLPPVPVRLGPVGRGGRRGAADLASRGARSRVPRPARRASFPR